MGLFKPSELQAFLNSLGVQANKTLSQNFLIDGNIIHKIHALAQVSQEDWVLEIGPGPGALTESLLAAGARVIAVEKDALFAKALSRLQTADNRLCIIEGDALDIASLEPILRTYAQGKPGKIIANLPYHITSPILTTYVPRIDLFSSLTVMVQKEVGERMAATEGNKVYGSLSVFLRFFSDPQYGFTVQPGSFSPKPKVHSAVVKLELKPCPLPQEALEPFFLMTRTLFSQRRKMIRSTLKKIYGEEKIHQAFMHCSISPTARPEQLSLDQFLTLFHALS